MKYGRLHSCLLLALICGSGFVRSHYPVAPEYDVCNPKTPAGYIPPTVYLSLTNSTEVFVNWTNTSGSHHSCHMVFKGCDYCKLKVEPVDPPFRYPSCFWTKEFAENSNECRPGCVYFYLLDEEYSEQKSKMVSRSSDALDFVSESRRLQVKACADKIFPANISMRLRITAIEKIEYLNEADWSYSARKTFKSPFFPEPYKPTDETYKYQIFARPGYPYIVVIFDDWVISPCSNVSVINGTFYGADATLCDSMFHCCPIPRRAIQSTEPVMTFIFKTGENRLSGHFNFYNGFKATVYSYSNIGQVPDIRTDCGGIITDPGDAISLLYEADGHDRDCIWIIRVADGYQGVYVNLIEFDASGRTQSDGFSSTTPRSLEIRGGLTSAGAKLSLQSSHISGTGFYVRLRGTYTQESTILLAYSSYTYGCSSRWDYFLCKNKRCILERLTCDKVDHCGDNSDEVWPQCGESPGSGTSDGSNGSSVKVGVIVPVVTSVFLAVSVIMCLIICFVRRCRRMSSETYGQQRQDAGNNSRGRHRRRRNQNVQMNVTLSSSEHPPSYEEVIQNTPIGCLNMAFSWSHTEQDMSQPPTYEEATSPVTPFLPEEGRQGRLVPFTSSNSVSTISDTVPQPIITDNNNRNNNNSSSNNRVASSVAGSSFMPGSARNVRTAHGGQQQVAPPPSLRLAVHTECYMSSSSSSEDAEDTHPRLDSSSSSSSSDSCLGNGHSLVPRDSSASSPGHCTVEPRTGSPEARDRRSIAKPERDCGDVQVVLGSPSASKHCMKYVHRKPDAIEGCDQQHRQESNELYDIQDVEHQNRPSAGLIENSVERSNVRHQNAQNYFEGPARERRGSDFVETPSERRFERDSREPNDTGTSTERRNERDYYRASNDLERPMGHADLSENGTFDERGSRDLNGEKRYRDREDRDNASWGRARDRYPSHQAPDRSAERSKQSRREELAGASRQSRHILSNGRSQSCANLATGDPKEGIVVREEDKRFSYAGAGDNSLHREDDLLRGQGRGLFRGRPREHLDKFSDRDPDLRRNLTPGDSWLDASHSNPRPGRGVGSNGGGGGGGNDAFREDQSHRGSNVYSAVPADRLSYSDLSTVPESEHSRDESPNGRSYSRHYSASNNRQTYYDDSQMSLSSEPGREETHVDRRMPSTKPPRPHHRVVHRDSSHPDTDHGHPRAARRPPPIPQRPSPMRNRSSSHQDDLGDGEPKNSGPDSSSISDLCLEMDSSPRTLPEGQRAVEGSQYREWQC
ncbi:uncharacterized protein LOC101856879 [Aplysia californica]|uniref:Uncharacterized protein LOC101856879 n=1 Tax=Aplysia californica TaxID=6500 RepID=A0ABM1VR86_APLCA|nr:uncharacterized protein LOC101856879 [Aplysia californica]